MPLAGFLMTTFPMAKHTWEPPHAVSSAVPPRMGTPFAVVATRNELGHAASPANSHEHVHATTLSTTNNKFARATGGVPQLAIDAN